MELQTERLILRPWKESDAESCYEYAKDPPCERKHFLDKRDHPGSFIGGWNVCGGFKEYRKAGGLCRPYSGRGMQYAGTRR